MITRPVPAATIRLRLSLMWNMDLEYAGYASYKLTRNLGLAGGYDSDMGWGAGLRLALE